MNKKIVLVMMVVLSFSQTSFADGGHSTGAASDRGSMGMMDSTGGVNQRESQGAMNYEQLHQRMENVERLMDKTRNTKNENDHDALMHEHMSELQNMMGMMHGMMMGNNGPGYMAGMQGSTPDIQSMMNNQQMMGQRLDMMQRFMEQMLEQQSMMFDR